VWREVLKSTGFVPPFHRIYRVWFLSNLGRYLPGKLWTFLGTIYLLEKKEGVSIERSFYTSILAQAVSVISGLVLAVVFLDHMLYSKFNHSWIIVIPTLILLFGFLVLIIFPQTPIGLVNFLLKLLKKQKVNFYLRRKDVIFFVIFYVFSWLFLGLSFFVFVKSITPLSWDLYFNLTAAFSASTTLGFLAIFAPGGIGVREGILSGLLGIYFPSGIPALISLLSRIWMTLIEVISSLIGLTVGSSSRRRANVC
jgi:glycosyltransferase 2 family protein